MTMHSSPIKEPEAVIYRFGSTIFLALTTDNTTPFVGTDVSPDAMECYVTLESSASYILDISESIFNVSKDPLYGGGFCDVHVAHMLGRGKVALKKLRQLGGSKKVKKVNKEKL